MTAAPSTEALAEHVYNVGRALWSAVLIGDPPTAIAALRERMMRPRPGDLVIEVGRFGQAFDPDSVGRLIRVEGDPAYPDRWVIEPLHRPGEEQGWGNAQFVALTDQPSSAKWVAE